VRINKKSNLKLFAEDYKSVMIFWKILLICKMAITELALFSIEYDNSGDIERAS
jgi:hypothetical protein